ncbi:phosphotransferase enzyme family protein [Glycomyces tarimensis]
MEPAQVAERLGLGGLRRPASVLKSGEPHPVWKLATASGPWVVKVVRPWGDFWQGVVAQAGKLELAAWQAGVAMPEPLPPPSAETGLWRPIGEDHYARACRFLEGTRPTAPLAPHLAKWTGTVTAAFEQLAIEADPGVDADFNTHPESDWDDWLAQAKRLGVLDVDGARELKDLAARINAIVGETLASGPVKLVMHRDTSPDNILVTADGPVLLDFDHAGPQVPWWELIGIAFSEASPDLGRVEPDRATVEACLNGYAAAGGRIGATDETAFTGLLALRLSYAAYQLWMACGHRGGSRELQAAFGQGLRDSITALTAQVKLTKAWAAWLRA